MMGTSRCVILLFTLLLWAANAAPPESHTTRPKIPEEIKRPNSTEIVTPAVKQLETPTIFLLTTLEVAEADVDSTLESMKEKNKKNSAKLSKLGNNMKSLLSVFSVMSGFLSLLSVITTTSDLQVISDMFTGVNRKLDQINDKLDKLDNSVELQGLLSNYIPWQYSVKNGIEKLIETYKAMVEETDINKRRLIAENFILFFENNQIESNINNLIKLTTTTDAVHQNMLFNELIDEAGCDFVRLTRIYMHVRRIFYQGTQLVLAYNSFKQMDPPEIKKYLNALIFIRNMYQSRVWHCKETTIAHSKKDITDIVKANAKFGITTVLTKINSELSRKYPWYSWSIVTVKKLLASQRNSTLGNQFYEMEAVGPHGSNLVVIWQGSKENSQCEDIQKANTVAVLTICKSCHQSHVFTPNNMLNKNKCRNDQYPQVKAFIDRREPMREEIEKKKTDIFWVAAGFKASGNPCNHRCNGHGECKVVPYTDQFQCFCHNNYEGKMCDKKIQMKRDISKLISDLQSGYKNAFSVPSLTNVLIQGENIAKQLKKMIQRIDNQFELTHILLKYISDLQKLDYILKISFSYSKKKITVDAFSRRMKAFLSLNPIDFIFQQLSNAILAEGFTDIRGKDFFNTFKRMIASNRDACSTQYGSEATILLERLSRLDITAAESILAYYSFESNYLNPENMKRTLENAKQLVRDSKRRMRSYARYWEHTSCPPLNVTNLSQTGCGAFLSFEGMKVKLSCDGGRAAVPKSIECVNVNGNLQWSATPKCEASWSRWSKWSACASTCGNATQSRRRRCLGQSDSEKCKGPSKQVRKCFVEDCCQEKYGKFKCNNNKCISLSRVCDGNDDCLDAADESKSRCKYLRSGDRIALRNMAYSQEWLSVQYTDAVQASLYYGRAYLNHCIKGDHVTSSEWNSCAGQSLLIYGNYQNGKKGKAIRFGDKIAMYYRKTNYHYRWFICYPTYCMTYTCPKKAGSFTFGPNGGCDEYEFYIINYNDKLSREPVKAGDVITIANNRGSIKGNGYNRNINTDDCTVNRALDDRIECNANAWQIFIK